MKPRFRNCILLVLSILAMTNALFAQDTLYLVNREKIHCRVKSVNRSDVDYVLWSSQAGPLFAVSKALVHKIVYETGSSVVINELTEPVHSVRDSGASRTPAMLISAKEAERQGREDAENNYDFRKSRNNGIILGATSTVFYLIPGIIATAVIAGHPPKDENLNLPDPDRYYQNADYRDAYRLTAKRIKSRKVWGGFVTGAGLVSGTAIGLLVFL